MRLMTKTPESIKLRETAKELDATFTILQRFESCSNPFSDAKRKVFDAMLTLRTIANDLENQLPENQDI